MDELTDIYKRIEYLRNNGVKMKEIADRVDMAPSVLSALYSSVLPAYIDLLKTRTPDEALDEALALVNNVSKKRLLNNVGSVRLLLQEMEPDVQSEAESGNSFIKLLGKEAKESVQEVYNYSGMYLSYSLSSSTDSLKIEPYMICASENNEYVKVGMINAYKSVHWGSGIISNHQNSYLMFNERDLPQFALVTIYLQLPHYEFPNMLKGLYLCLDYNHNPIARRIVLVKQSDSTDVNQFLEMEGCLVPRAELTPELEVYYNYTCQEGDYAWEKGIALAKQTIDRYKQRHNDSIPRKVSYTLWSSEFIETGGATIAQVLYMLGVEPVRDAFGRVSDLKLIPSTELGRPRIDVVADYGKACNFFAL